MCAIARIYEKKGGKRCSFVPIIPTLSQEETKEILPKFFLILLNL